MTETTSQATTTAFKVGVGDIPLDDCLSQARAAGYAGVELGRKFPRQPDELRPHLEKHGLMLASGWHSGQLAEASVDDELERVAAWRPTLTGCPRSATDFGRAGACA